MRLDRFKLRAHWTRDLTLRQATGTEWAFQSARARTWILRLRLGWLGKGLRTPSASLPPEVKRPLHRRAREAKHFPRRCRPK